MPRKPPQPDPFWWRDDAPAPLRPVEGGIQIHSTRGQVARTWWSLRFIGVLEEMGMGGRLARGKRYARAGQIVSLDLDVGAVTAQVQGTRPKPYRVRMSVPAFGKAEWAAATEALAADASHAAALLNGELPREVEDVFAAVGLSLFPASTRELAMDCSCPDQAVPCKHLAAVCYVLAERFDADPFQILALRGRDREELLAELRERRSAGPEGSAPPLDELMGAFFTAGSLDVPGGPRTPADALLDQIPEFPIAVRGEPLTEVLRPIYRAMAGP